MSVNGCVHGAAVMDWHPVYKMNSVVCFLHYLYGDDSATEHMTHGSHSLSKLCFLKITGLAWERESKCKDIQGNSAYSNLVYL